MRGYLLSFALALLLVPTAIGQTASDFQADQRTTAKLTLRYTGNSLSDITKDLSQKANLTLSVDNVLGKEVFAANVKDMPLRDFMLHMADLSLGEWAAVKDGYRLISSPKRVKEEEQALNEKRSAQITSELANIADQRLKPADFTALAAKAFELRNQVNLASGAREDYDKYRSYVDQLNSLGQNGPEARLVVRIAQAMPVADLLAVPPGGRTVFSSSPNRLQKSLPESIRSAVAEYVTEYNAWAKGLDDARSTVGVERTNSHTLSSMWPNFAAKPLSKGIGKVLFIVTRSNYLSPLMMRTTAYGPDGAVLGSASMTIRMPNLMGSKMPRDLTGSGPIELPKAATDFAGCIYASRSATSADSPRAKEMYVDQKHIVVSYALPSRATAALSNDTLNFLRSPEKTEPLSIYVGPMFLAAAEAAGKQLIVNLPDRFFESFSMTLFGGGTLEKFWTAIRSSSMTVVDENGLLQFRSKWLLPDRARVDRAALQNLLQSAEKKSVVDVQDFAKYMQSSPVLFPLGRTIDDSYLAAWNGRILNGAQMGTSLYRDRPMWKVAAFLGPNAFQAHPNNTLISIPGPASPLGMSCQEYLYGGASWPIVILAHPMASDADNGGMINSLSIEPTEVFSAGPGPGLKVSVALETENACVAYSEENGAPILLNAPSYVDLTNSPYRIQKRFLPVQMVNCTISILNEAGDHAEITLSTLQRVSGGEAKYEFLPIEFRKSVEEFRKLLGGQGG